MCLLLTCFHGTGKTPSTSQSSNTPSFKISLFLTMLPTADLLSQSMDLPFITSLCCDRNVYKEGSCKRDILGDN